MAVSERDLTEDDEGRMIEVALGDRTACGNLLLVEWDRDEWDWHVAFGNGVYLPLEDCQRWRFLDC